MKQYRVTFQRWNERKPHNQLSFNEGTFAMHIFNEMCKIAPSAVENIRHVTLESVENGEATLIKKVSF